jgi:hypothetical protein
MTEPTHPYPTATTPSAPGSQARSGLSNGALLGIIGGVALLLVTGVVAAAFALGVFGSDDDPVVAVASATPVPEGSVDAPTEPEVGDGGPAEFTLPEGYIPVTNDALGVVLGVPQGWDDQSAEYAALIEQTDANSADESISLIGAWVSAVPGVTFDQNMGLHTEAPAVPLEDYHASTLLGFEVTTDSATIVEEEEFTTELGTPALRVLIESSSFGIDMQTHFYNLGGNGTYITVSCTAIEDESDCDELLTVVNTLAVAG